MSTMPHNLVSPQSGFSDEQAQYLRGFFAGVLQRPFVGHTASGQITSHPSAGSANLAEPVKEETFFGTPVSDLCAE